MSKNKQLIIIITLIATVSCVVLFFMLREDKPIITGEDSHLTYGLCSETEGFIQSYLAESADWKPDKKAVVMRIGESDTIACTLN